MVVFIGHLTVGMTDALQVGQHGRLDLRLQIEDEQQVVGVAAQSAWP